MFKQALRTGRPPSLTLTLYTNIARNRYAKLNVLHWHMTDTQSFPLEVKSSPKLWEAAYSDQEKFTQLDIASVVEYARLRGVRVIVEFDMRTCSL